MEISRGRKEREASINFVLGAVFRRKREEGLAQAVVETDEMRLFGACHIKRLARRQNLFDLKTGLAQQGTFYKAQLTAGSTAACGGSRL
eukprot:6195051-Pleurochrysis_carterae.AAC.4